MNTKKLTPRNLKAIEGARLQGEVPNTRWGRLGRVNLSRLLPRTQDGMGGHVSLS
jgi:hypothetical protein